LIKQKIFTTLTKAKAARGLAEQLITLGKRDTLQSRRLAFRILGEHSLVTLLFKDIAPRFGKRIGGYTRIIRWGFRRGDGAEVVILELTEQKKVIKKPKKEKALLAEKGMPSEVPKEKEVTKKEEAPRPKPKVITEEKAPLVKKPAKKFFGGLRKIFRKKGDSL
jgi:large subunit ribosomal protein L17